MYELTSDSARQTFQRGTDEFIALLATADANGDAAQPIPGMRWSVREVAAHVLAGMRGYLVMAGGGDSAWKSFTTSAEDNDASIAATEEHDLGAISDALPTAAQRLADFCYARGVSPVPWHQGTEVPAVVMLGLAAGEFLIHGRDIARAIRAPWTMSGSDARVLTAAGLTIVPHFVDTSAAQGFSAAYDLRLSGDAHYAVTFQDGVLTTRPGSIDRADCHVAADARAFALLAYGRTSLATPILTGKMLAWGRRPWLAFQLLPKLKNP